MPAFMLFFCPMSRPSEPACTPRATIFDKFCRRRSAPVLGRSGHRQPATPTNPGSLPRTGDLHAAAPETGGPVLRVADAGFYAIFLPYVQAIRASVYSVQRLSRAESTPSECARPQEQR